MDGKLAAEGLDGSPGLRRVLRDVNREARCFRLYNDYLPCQKRGDRLDTGPQAWQDGQRRARQRVTGGGSILR